VKGNKVASANYLYRRAYNSPLKNFMNPDGSATSRVFKLRPKDEGKLSVDVKELTNADNAVGDPAKFLLFELSVAALETVAVEANAPLAAIHDPLTLENHGTDNPAHALIIGMSENDDIVPGLLAMASKKVYPV
jgi:hypothetical protein